MASYTFPSSMQLMQIEQALVPDLKKRDPIFDILPDRTQDVALLQWEQYDNFTGLTQVRGLNGQPPRVKRVGIKSYQMPPGVYGEFTLIDEREVTVRRQIGSVNQPINVEDLVTHCGFQLLDRQLKRLAWLGWTLLVKGVFSVTDVKGAIVHADGYTQRLYTAAVTWATAASATPLADFRAIKLFHRGFSTHFDSSSKAYMNQKTLNNMLANTNAADIGGRRVDGLQTVNSLPQLQTIFTRDDLPNIVVHDEGYYDDTGTFNTFIPDNVVVVVGRRDSLTPIGEWIYTRNAVNPGVAPGPYYRVFEEDEIPPTVEIHRGFNGGHAIYFPSSVVVMNV